MDFNQTAVKTAVKEIGSGGEGTPGPPDRLDIQLKNAAGESFELFSRKPLAVLCGSYQRGIPSLVRAYEKLSAAGMRVLSPSGLDFVAQIDGFVLKQDEVEIPPEAVEMLPLNCIRAADLVWLHAPDGYVGLNGALEIGFASAARVPVYAEEMPSDIALRSLVTISPLDQVIAETSTGEQGNPGASLLPLQEYYSAIARGRAYEHKSAQDVMLLITEEIGELARQNPGQRQQLSRTSKTGPGS
ncbi:MAG: hypothetical protein ACLP41_11480 [Acidimicrobiales bacterium]|jgi:hypothetical protein